MALKDAMAAHRAKTYSVKVAPNASPNDDGRWIKVICRSLRGVRRFSDAAYILESVDTFPKDHHVVRYEEVSGA